MQLAQTLDALQALSTIEHRAPPQIQSALPLVHELEALKERQVQWRNGLAAILGLALSHNYALIALAFVIAGLGNALFDPALSASILEIAPVGHQSRMLGLKSTLGSIGNIAGPALVVLFTPVLPAQGIFLIAAGTVFLTILVVVATGARPERSRAHLRSRTADSEAR